MKKFYIVALACMVNISVYSSPGKVNYSPSSMESVRTNLYEVKQDGSTILLDGDLTQYDVSYSNAVDGMDARKMSNFSENIGMLRGTTTLAIERRHTIVDNDSIFYRMWNMHELTYEVQFVISMNQPGLRGYLEDSYLHKKTPLDLNATNNIKFIVNNDMASYNPRRFTIIFTTAQPSLLPFTYTLVNGSKENNTAVVAWKTIGENNMLKYIIERSYDGNHFTTAGSVNANNLKNNGYRWNDMAPSQGINYYRILGVSASAETEYSDLLKIDIGSVALAMKITPNPAIGNKINLVMSNKKPGAYDVRLVNSIGQMIASKKLIYTNDEQTETISIDQQVTKGIYQLIVTDMKGQTTVLPVIF